MNLLRSSKLATIYTILLIEYLTRGVVGQSFRTSPRNLNVLTGNVKCIYPLSSAKCVCPGSCMTQIGNTTNCSLKKCYAWDQDLGACKETGHNYVTPLVLQAIPFTGIFGSGFGNIGRWDLFGMYLGVLFGGCCFIVLATGLCAACTGHTEEEVAPCTTCNSCLWSIAILALYIWGIVQTAEPGAILDENGCPLSGF